MSEANQIKLTVSEVMNLCGNNEARVYQLADSLGVPVRIRSWYVAAQAIAQANVSETTIRALAAKSL